MMQPDPDAREAAFQARMEALTRDYLHALPARRAALAEHWHACADTNAEAAWERVREIAHKLAGSAPCYGLDAIGKAARDLDKLLSGAAANRARVVAGPYLDRLLLEMDAAIGAA
jgi:HPt (histidine-containing phosphotransfer) domain-containing protein